MIQRLKKTDRDLILKMIGERGAAIESLPCVDSFLSNDDNYFLAYIEDERIVGFLVAYALQRYDGRKAMLYLHEIDVLASHRQRGIATKLMDEIKRIKEACAYDKLFLITNKSNDAAVALYRSSGGEVNSEDDVVFTFKQ